MNSSLNPKIRKVLTDANSIVITSHIRPDGDAVGSLLAFGLALQAKGKQVQMVLADGIPPSFRHLFGADQVQRKIKKEYDLSVVVDCSDLQRTGGVFGERPPDLNVDHHITNLYFAGINLVDTSAVATASVLADHMPAWGLDIDYDVASALLTGIVSDTLGFRTSNVTSHALRQTANLMDLGANLNDLYHRALIRRSYESALFWGIGLDRMQREDRLIWTTLTLEDREKVGYPGNDDADLVNLLSTVEDADITVIFVEQKGKHVKVSWRAVQGFDVSKIALQFGGGGHAAAAGADIPGSLEEVQEKVLQATRLLLNHHNPSTIIGRRNLSNA